MSVASSICIERTIAGAMIAMAVFGISDLAQAEKIGVAAAVNPDAFSSQGNGATSQLRIGKSIFFDERISTTGSGIVQVLLLDGSTFTVGPGSNLVIDKFVYDPRKQRGEIVASMSKGAMRFIGGKISKGREADEAELTRLFPDTFGEVCENAPVPPLCSDCEFLKWGAFTTQVSFSNGAETTEYVDSIHGWWVAGDLTAPVEIDALAARQATATYSGHVVGTVVSLGNDQWQTYDAAGDLIVNWEFAPRAGDLTISNFDGRSFGTGEHGLTQPTASLNQFSGSLTQFSGPAISNFGGNAAGSFVRGPRSPAQGVIGNWNVGGNGYKATGIFAGSGIPKAGN